MQVRFVGGPKDGQVREIADGMERVLVIMPKGDPDPDSPCFPVEEVVYRRTRWTRDGCRLFVVEGYDRSLIGDEEIDAAAEWLAEQVHEGEGGDLPVTAMPGHITWATDQIRASLEMARRHSGVDGHIGFVATARDGRRLTVKVGPGRVEGYDGRIPAEVAGPCWRWPQVVTAPSGRYR